MTWLTPDQRACVLIFAPLIVTVLIAAAVEAVRIYQRERART